MLNGMPPALLLLPQTEQPVNFALWLHKRRGGIVMAGLLAFAGPIVFFTGALSVMRAPTAVEFGKLGLWWTLYGVTLWGLLLVAGMVAALTNAVTAGRIAILIEQGVVYSTGSAYNYAIKNARSPRSRFDVGDAQALHFEDASFDHTMALLVMNFIPDHIRATSEMRRVTRPHGVVSACVWDYNAGMQMLRFFWDEVVALDPAMQSKDERHMKLSREGQLARLWERAGLVNVQEKPLVIEQVYTSFNDYWEPFLNGAGPGGAYVVSLPEERRRELETRIRKRILGNRDDGSFVLKARAWCVRGEVGERAKS